jgi:diacylglycerol kinase (ATP)
MSRIGVITNPTSGSGRGTRWGHEALTELASYGHQLRDLSSGSWAASYAAAMQHRKELDALVVVGGDGMVHLGIQVCGDSKLPLGIVAAGSGNDGAITLDLPILDVPAAVRRIHEGLQGEVATVDLGKVSGPGIEHPAKPRYFLAVLSAGLDAAVASYARRLTRPRGPLKYKFATARELPRYSPYGVSLTVDGKSWEQQCALVAVANSPVFGGGLIISPHSSITDGKLEFVVTEALSKVDILKIFPKLNDGSHLGDPRITVVQAEEVVIKQSPIGAALPPAFADGELLGADPVTVKVAKRALRVLGGRPK